MNIYAQKLIISDFRNLFKKIWQICKFLIDKRHLKCYNSQALERDALISECAGIGRQARLRGVCGDAYGFKSRHSHHKIKGYQIGTLYFVLQHSALGRDLRRLCPRRRWNTETQAKTVQCTVFKESVYDTHIPHTPQYAR